MTNTQAILIGAALVGSSILLTNGFPAARAANNAGPYQLMHHSNTAANAGVFRLDTSGGGVSYCYITGGQSLACTNEVK